MTFPIARTVALAALIAVTTAACGVGSSGTPSTTTPTTETTVPMVTNPEVNGLLFMIEEEKLAHDIYVELAATWDLRVFENIAAAESRHQAEAASILSELGIQDPTASNPPGVFDDPSLQALHDDLVQRGGESVAMALEVGALIEETDIADLRERASTVAAIQSVYERLETGSMNHLRAFDRNLSGIGIERRPVVLDAAEYALIVAASTGGGAGN